MKYSHANISMYLFSGLLFLTQIIFGPFYLQTIQSSKILPYLGIILILIIFLEPILIYFKYKKIYFNQKNNDSLIFPWIGHLALTSVIFMSGLQLMGISFQSGLAISLFILFIIKELFILGLILFFLNKKSQNKIKNNCWVTDILTSLIFVLFYIGFWQLIFNNTTSGESIAEKILSVIIAGIIFILFFYFPTRGIYFPQEWNQKEKTFYLSLILSTIIAVWPILL